MQRLKPYYETSLGKLYHGCCLEIMPGLEQVDMILADLPYGITKNKWDSIINLDLLWECYKGITRPNSAIVLTSSQPFTSALVMSNLEMFRYDLIWEKTISTGFLDCRFRPLRSHEIILVFYDKKPIYNPQKTEGKPWFCSTRKKPKSSWGEQREYTGDNKTGLREPRSVLKIPNPNHKTLHRTQKPLELYAYLVRTYTNKNGLVLDNCSGSGTLGVTCEHLKRRWIMIEKEEEYCEIAAKRIENDEYQLNFFDEEKE